MKIILLSLLFCCFLFSCTESIPVQKKVMKSEVKKSTEAQEYWNKLKTLCDNSFEGTLELPENDEQFGGKKLVMHVRACNDSIIKIPFFVGDDKSRTWVLKLKDDRITLKHDHRHEDGSEDAITQYGGTTTNSGQASIQMFPADDETSILIPEASTNVWWITIDDKQFTYNLRRLGTPRIFRVSFDLTRAVETPDAPWGWSSN